MVLDSEIPLAPPEVPQSAREAFLSCLPERSRALYQKTFDEFQAWCEERKKTDFSEPTLLAYFLDVVNKGLIASLWPKFSMLKSTLNLKVNVDIGKYNNLIAFIKRQREGYVPKKSKILQQEEITRFISEAPNINFLMTKVVLIFGLAGSLRKHELLKLSTDDVQDLETKFLVTVKSTKRKTNRIFTIVDNEEKTFLNLIKHYISLRPKHTPHKRFFVYYRNNRCTVQPIGINSFSKLPSQIATFLQLDQPHLYTGHCFRRSSNSIKSDGGLDCVPFRGMAGESILQ